MRMSEQLMAGSLLMRAVRGRLSDGHGGGCALGMMSLQGETEYRSANYKLRKLKMDTYPCGCRVEDWERNILIANGLDAVIHLFDQHVMATESEVSVGVIKWSLEMLADWLESVDDPREEVKSEEAADAGVPVCAEVGG